MENSHAPLSVEEAKALANAYYTLGQDFKVAVEVVPIAVDEDLVDVGEEVIAVGGTKHGADTAIVVKASSMKGMMGPSVKRRLEVKEIVAMPRARKWWK